MVEQRESDMASTGRELAERRRWAEEPSPRPPGARPRVCVERADEPTLPATQSAFYELLCIGWLALAAASIWIAILC